MRPEVWETESLYTIENMYSELVALRVDSELPVRYLSRTTRARLPSRPMNKHLESAMQKPVSYAKRGKFAGLGS
jgi:hypothetical protein